MTGTLGVTVVRTSATEHHVSVPRVAFETVWFEAMSAAERGPSTIAGALDALGEGNCDLAFERITSLLRVLGAHLVVPATLAAREGVDELRVALIAATEWRPMETAPKDGTRIVVLCNKGHPSVCKWLTHCWDSDRYAYTAGDNFVGWLPLPEVSP